MKINVQTALQPHPILCTYNGQHIVFVNIIIRRSFKRDAKNFKKAAGSNIGIHEKYIKWFEKATRKNGGKRQNKLRIRTSHQRLKNTLNAWRTILSFAKKENEFLK